MTHAGRAASSPEIFRPFLTVCLTVFPFEFRPRTFTIGFYGKKSFISELMILECSFPLNHRKTVNPNFRNLGHTKMLSIYCKRFTSVSYTLLRPLSFSKFCTSTGEWGCPHKAGLKISLKGSFEPKLSDGAESSLKWRK